MGQEGGFFGKKMNNAPDTGDGSESLSPSEKHDILDAKRIDDENLANMRVLLHETEPGLIDRLTDESLPGAELVRMLQERNAQILRGDREAFSGTDSRSVTVEISKARTLKLTTFSNGNTLIETKFANPKMPEIGDIVTLRKKDGTEYTGTLIRNPAPGSSMEISYKENGKNVTFTSSRLMHGITTEYGVLVARTENSVYEIISQE
jgi:hypothetical protein